MSSNSTPTLEALAAALCLAQSEMPAAKKDSVNPFFRSKYAGLSSIMQAAIPVLSKHGLAVSQFVTHINGESALETILLHTSGQYISSVMPLFLKTNDPQGQGSAITYARRYAFMAAIGMVADEDDDGNATRTAAPAPALSPLMINPTQRAIIAELLPQSGRYKDIADYEEIVGRKINTYTASQAATLIKKLEEFITENLRSKEESKDKLQQHIEDAMSRGTQEKGVPTIEDVDKVGL